MQAIFSPEQLENLSFSSQRNAKQPWRVHTDHLFTLINDRTGKIVLQIEITAPLDTDLATIPWWLGWAMPRNGWHIRGCVFHDEAYKRQELSRSLADFALKVIHNYDRPKNGFSFIQMWLLWAALRLTGWWCWNKNA